MSSSPWGNWPGRHERSGMTIEIGESFSPGGGLRETFLAAFGGDDLVGFAGWDEDGVFQIVAVRPDRQRQGIATMLWKRAQSLMPGLRHSSMLTPDGRAWAMSLGPEGDASAAGAAKSNVPVSVGEWADLVTPDGEIRRFGFTFAIPENSRPSRASGLGLRGCLRWRRTCSLDRNHARQSVQGLAEARGSAAAQRSPRHWPPRCGKPAGDHAGLLHL
jgi:hypothetical protein